MSVRIHFLSCCILLTVICMSDMPVYAQTAQGGQHDRQSLKDIAEKIEAQKKKLKQVEQEEAAVISRLNDIERRLIQESREYDSIAQQIKSLQDDIHTTRSRMQAMEQESALQEKIVQQRLSALYKYHRRSGLRILLSSRNYNDLLRTENALSLIVGRDRDLLSSSLATLEQQRRYESELQERRAQLIEARTQIARKRNEIKNTQEQRTAHLSTLQREKTLQIKALRELEEYARKLQKFIDDLPRDTTEYTSAGVPFSQMRGRLDFPVKGDIIGRFGRQEHPELKTFTYQKGINIKAPAGTPVRAVHDGRVAFADWFKGYGFMIIIDHGEHYHSLSAHAAELLKNVGDTVAAGETIARVGDTNSIKGAGLYFEVRQHGKPQDPLKWLRKGAHR
jgi:murein hydrolase activator